MSTAKDACNLGQRFIDRQKVICIYTAFHKIFIKGEHLSDYLFNAVFEFLQTSSSSSVLRPSPSSDFIAIASCLVHRITLGPI